MTLYYDFYDIIKYVRMKRRYSILKNAWTNDDDKYK